MAGERFGGRLVTCVFEFEPGRRGIQRGNVAARFANNGWLVALAAWTRLADLAASLVFERLAPPLLAKIDKTTGEPRKMSFGPWVLKAFGVLKRFKVLRGTPLDIFGYSEERRTERKLIADYEAMLDEILQKLTPENHPLAVGLAAIPEKIRGFGHVKAQHLKAAKADEAALLDQFRATSSPMLKAAE